jgi:hypothetical protein
MAVGVYRRCGVGADSLPLSKLLTGAQSPIYRTVYSHPRHTGVMRGSLGLYVQRYGWVSALGGLMSHDEYRRLYAACIAMARQSSLPNVRDRWLAIATV